MLVDSLTHPGIVVAALEGLGYGDREGGVVRVVHHVVVGGPGTQVVVVGVLQVAVIPE